jgi:hypothetical protein
MTIADYLEAIGERFVTIRSLDSTIRERSCWWTALRALALADGNSEGAPRRSDSPAWLAAIGIVRANPSLLMHTREILDRAAKTA